MRRAYSYERVSSGKQLAGTGLNRQQDAAATYCAANGFTLDADLDLTDRGVSAYTGSHLKGALGRFLDLSAAQQLGPDPLLLVEDIDRLSRLEAIDGLLDVFGALIKAGVSIHTLGDGQTYSRETLREDGSKLLVLVVKIQAAHEYSRRLSKRIEDTWKRTHDKIRAGEKARPTKCPHWLTWDEEGQEFRIDHERAKYLLRMYELAEQGLGLNLISRGLNEEGYRTPQGKTWTSGNVRSTLQREEACGVRTLKHQERDPKTGKRRMVSVERIEGYYPQLITPEQHAHVQALIRGRYNAAHVTSRRSQCSFIGQGITTCSTCGSLCGRVAPGASKRRANKQGYVRCNSIRDKVRCGNTKQFHLPKLHAHIITRLSYDQLIPLLPQSDVTSAVTQQADLVGKLTTQHAMAGEKATKLTERVSEAAIDGQAITLLKTLQAAADDATAQAQELAASLKAAKDKLALLQQAPSASAEVTALQPVVQEVFHAMATDTATNEQRWALHRALTRLDIHIHLNGNEQLCGLQVADGPIVWEKVSELSGVALSKGWTSVTTQTDEQGITYIEGILPIEKS